MTIQEIYDTYHNYFTDNYVFNSYQNEWIIIYEKVNNITYIDNKNNAKVNKPH